MTAWSASNCLPARRPGWPTAPTKRWRAGTRSCRSAPRISRPIPGPTEPTCQRLLEILEVPDRGPAARAAAPAAARAGRRRAGPAAGAGRSTRPRRPGWSPVWPVAPRWPTVEDDAADPTAVVDRARRDRPGPRRVPCCRSSALIASADATRCALTCTGGCTRIGRTARPPPPLPTGTWLLTLPAHHIAGLQVLFRAVAEGTEPAIMDTALPFTADRLHRARSNGCRPAAGSSRWCRPSCTGSWPIPTPPPRWPPSPPCWSAARPPRRR